MGYSNDPGTVEKVRPILKILEEGKPCVWKVGPSAASATAYKIREALYIARNNPDLFPALAAAAERFSIRLSASHGSLADTVEAVLKTTSRLAHAPATAAQPDPRQVELALPDEPPPIPRPAAVPVPSRIAGPQTQYSVIDAWGKHGGGILHFTDAALGPDALLKLYRWAKLQQPELMLLTDELMPHLTICEVDPEVEEFQWKPEGE